MQVLKFYAVHSATVNMTLQEGKGHVTLARGVSHKGSRSDEQEAQTCFILATLATWLAAVGAEVGPH